MTDITGIIYFASFAVFLASVFIYLFFTLLSMIFEGYAFGDLCVKIMRIFIIIFVISGLITILSMISTIAVNLILYKGG